jgi:CheY-like chemotaxis protein
MEEMMKKSNTNTKTKEGKIIPFVKRCDVLVVEDEPAFVDLIERMIRSRFPNLSVQSSKDGIEGLEKAKAFKPRIVWTGVRMPRMDGLQMIELIRQDPALQDTRIIVCTGYYTEDVKKRALELGVDKLFPKPFKVEEALSAIADCLS